jgi:hypothetical protein
MTIVETIGISATVGVIAGSAAEGTADTATVAVDASENPEERVELVPQQRRPPVRWVYYFART